VRVDTLPDYERGKGDARRELVPIRLRAWVGLAGVEPFSWIR